MALDQDFLKSIGLDNDEVISKVVEKSMEDEKGLLLKRDELLGKVTSYKDRLSQYEGIDLDEYSKMKQRLKELADKDMTVEERLEAAKIEAAKEWESKYSDAAKQLEEMTSKERTRTRNEAVFRSVGDKGDADLILDVIAAKDLVSVVDKDGQHVLQVKNLAGDKELESIDKLIDEMKASEKYSRLFNSSGLSGGGSRNSSGSAGGKDSGVFGAARMRAARGG